MGADLVIAPEAEHDLDEAYAWYEEQRNGLGEEFLTSADACIAAIRRTPKAGRLVHKNYRRALTRRFPYAVYYRVDGDNCVVYRVLDCRQKPQKTEDSLK